MFGAFFFRFDQHMGGVCTFNHVVDVEIGPEDIRKISTKSFVSLAMSEEEQGASGWAIIPLPLDSKGLSYAFWAHDRGAGKKIIHSIVLAVPSALEQLFIAKGAELLANLTNWANEFINAGKLNKKEIIDMVNSLHQSGKSLISQKKMEAKQIALVDEMNKYKDVMSKIYAVRGHIPSIVLHPNFPSKITQKIMKRLNGEKSVSDIIIELEIEDEHIDLEEVAQYLEKFLNRQYIYEVLPIEEF
ncbi:MAG: hypothetical protein ACFFC7_05560 [Candidatus Hermodarchaeota archaeon]